MKDYKEVFEKGETRIVKLKGKDFRHPTIGRNKNSRCQCPWCVDGRNHQYNRQKPLEE